MNITDIIPDNFTTYRVKIGQSCTFKITGATGRRIYGTNIYTEDSNIVTAAIHADVLHVGETKNITIKILSGQPYYVVSTQNNVSSLSYGSWGRSDVLFWDNWFGRRICLWHRYLYR